MTQILYPHIYAAIVLVARGTGNGQFSEESLHRNESTHSTQGADDDNRWFELQFSLFGSREHSI